MAKNCISCGKNIGLLGVRVPLLQDENLVICSECFSKMPKIIEELYKDSISSSDIDLCAMKDEVIYQLKQSGFNQETINVVSQFWNNKIACSAKLREQQRAALLEKMKGLKLTTGYNFEGYSIIDYIDVINSEVVLGTGFFSEVTAQIDDFLGVTSSPYENKIALAKNDAKEKLMHIAIEKEANALIGIDFDIMTIGANMIVVSANGTAVRIEKNNE